MAEELDPTAVKIDPPDPKLIPNWRKIFTQLAETATQVGLLSLTQGGSLPSAVSAAFGALNAVEVKDEDSAFILIAFSAAYAVDRLAPTAKGRTLAKDLGRGDRDGATVDGASIGRRILDALTEYASTQPYGLTSAFLEHPASLPLYRDLQPALLAILREARLEAFDDATAIAQLDAAFNAAPHAVFQAQPDRFHHLLKRLQTAGGAPARGEWDWRRYRAHLKEGFTVEPLLGQEATKIALAQLYIPLNAIWRTTPYSPDEDELSVARRADRDIKYACGPLHETMAQWVNAPHDGGRYDVRLVFGGPGSGKSSFCKAFAADMADREDIRPVLIELRHYRDEDLRDYIQKHHSRDRRRPVFEEDPLATASANRPYLLIFDGLDEIARPGSRTAEQAADAFANALKDLLRDFKDGEALAIVTGRNAIMDIFRKKLRLRPEAALEALGYINQLSRDPESGESEALETLAEGDRRLDWWRKYAKALDLTDPPPPAFTDASFLHSKDGHAFADVTNEPILCYLVAMSGYLTHNWEEAANNLNRVYERVIGDIWMREWGRDEDDEAGRIGATQVVKSKDDFFALMETVAVAAWWGGEPRIAQMDDFKAAMTAAETRGVCEQFHQSGDVDIATLALTFYLRPTDGRGFEFTHKSFSEYLVARFLMRSFITKILLPLDTGASSLTELRNRWAQRASRAVAGHEIQRFIMKQALLFYDDQPPSIALKETLEKFIFNVAIHGLPITDSTVSTAQYERIGFHALEEGNKFAQANMMICSSGFINCLNTNNLNDNILNSKRIQFNIHGKKYLKNLILRSTDSNEERFRSDLNFIELSNSEEQTGEIIDEENIDPYFSFLNLSFSSINYSKIFKINFLLCNFNICRFYKSKVFSSSFHACRLVGIQFNQSHIYNVLFSNNELIRCSFFNCCVERIDFSNLNLQGSFFRDSTMKDCNFVYTDMRSTDIENCYFENVRFDHAIANLSQKAGLEAAGVDISKVRFVEDENTPPPRQALARRRY